MATNSILTSENTTKAFSSDTLIADWSDSFQTLLQEKNSLLQYFSIKPSATSTIVKWQEQIIGPVIYNIETLTSQTVFKVDDEGMTEGMIIRFTKANGNSKDGLGRVTNVATDGKTITIEKYGETAISTLIVGDNIRVISNPQKEFSEGKMGNLYKTKTVENYTQIFERTVGMSRSLLQSSTVDKMNYMQTQIGYKLEEIYREIVQSAVWGYGNNSDTDKARTMKGLLELMKGSSVLAGSDPINKVLNSALKSLAANGSDTQQYIFVCHPDVAQKITGLKTVDQSITTGPESTTVGGSIQEFLGDTGRNRGRISLFEGMPNDQLLIIDPGYLGLTFLQSPISEKLPKTADGEVWRVLCELSLIAENAPERNILVKGL